MYKVVATGMYNNDNTRRKENRIGTNATILCSKYICDGKIDVFKPPKELQVENLSTEGLCVISSETFKEGSTIKLDITLDNVTYQSLFAKIIWNIKTDNIYRYGINIQNVSGRFKRQVHELEKRISTII